MMNQSAIIAIGKMKVVRDSIVKSVACGQFIEKIETLLVHFEQHLQVSIRNMVYIHQDFIYASDNLAYLCGLE
ncbi:hypothetical protein JVV93_21220, partial [Vibrio cholerae O1]